MLRWFCLIFGAYCLATAITSFLEKDGMSRRRVVSAKEARKLCFRPGDSYVKIDTALDISDAAYFTGLAAPEFSRCSPTLTFRLFDSELGESWEDLIGCSVEANRPLEDGLLTLRAKPDSGEQPELVQQLIAPVAGTDRKLWALSPPFSRRAFDAQIDWSRSDRVAGQLSRLADIRKNRPELEHECHEIRIAYEGEFGVEMPESALLILPFSDDPLERFRARKGSCVVPIRDSEGALFARIDRDFIESYGGMIGGVLSPSRGHVHTALADVLDTALPSRIGFVVPRTIAEFEKHERSKQQGWFLTGLVLSILGGFLVARRRLVFKRDRERASVQIEAEIERRRAAREEAVR